MTRSYLALPDRTALAPGAPPAVPARLVRIEPCTVAEWRELYARIGGPWHWHDRDAWDDATLAAHLADPRTSVYRVDADLPTGPQSGVGFVELMRHTPEATEIVYLGLDTTVLGMGLGRWIVTAAATAAYDAGATRVWLHTCTLDAPAALPNYLARGFVVERSEEYEAVVTEAP